LKAKLGDVNPSNLSSQPIPEQLLHNLLFFVKTQEGFSKQLSCLLKALSLQKQQVKLDTPLTLCSILGSSTNGVDIKW
jgi:hypothetical protein